MRLSDIMESNSVEGLLSDPLEDALDALSDGDELGSLFGKLVKGVVKGVKSVGKVALPIVKMVPGVGNAVSAAETGVNLAVGIGKKAGIGQSKSKPAPKAAAKAMPKRPASTAASPAVIQAAVRADKAKAAPKKSVNVAQTSSAVQRPAAAASIQPSIVVKAEPLDISRIVQSFSASVSPQLNQIAGLLQQQQLQAKAQSEHNARVKDAAFKKQLVKAIAAKG